MRAARRASKYRPVLGEFVVFAAAWDEGIDDPLFPKFQSESAARWFVRAHRRALVEAEAIAINGKQMLMHPARFHAIQVRVALDNARARG